jgi:hypothetical protein
MNSDDTLPNETPFERFIQGLRGHNIPHYAEWPDLRDAVVPKLRGELLDMAPEVIISRIEHAGDGFWRDLHFENPKRKCDKIIEDMLMVYASTTRCDLIADYVVDRIGRYGEIMFSTPGQVAELQGRLNEAVGLGNYRVFGGGKLPVSDDDDYSDIAVAVPLTFAAAKAMRHIKVDDDFPE